MHSRRFIDMTGLTFSHLTVIAAGELCKGGDRRWLCRCGACGAEVFARGKDLRRGDYKSCGCVGRAEAVDRARRFKLSHGQHGTPLYNKWRSMTARCAMDPDYVSRGIKVCERWRDFSAFAADMGPSWRPGLSLERDNNLVGYEPGNCRWIPLSEQPRNRTNCQKVVYDGKETFLWKVAELLGISRKTMWLRYNRGDRPPKLFRPLPEKRV